MTTAPRIVLDGARAAYVGPAFDLTPHRCATAVAAFALERDFDVAIMAKGGARLEAVRAALIPPGALHHLRARGAMAFVYLDAMGDDHARLARRWPATRGAVARLAETVAARIAEGASPLAATLAAADVVPRPAPSPAIAAVVRAIDADPGAFARVDAAARRAGLSSSRFQRLFHAAAGAPFRRYRLWRRLARAVVAMGARASLTDAAHEAGFASSAHFSSAFRAMFGLAPSTLLATGVRIETAPATQR